MPNVSESGLYKPVHGGYPPVEVPADIGPATAAEARLSEVEKALEPIVKLADAVFRDGMNTDKRDEAGVWGFDDATLTYGHLRATHRVREGEKV